MTGAQGQLRSLVESRAGETPDRVAYVEGATGRTLSWSDVLAAVPDWVRLGATLGPGARIGLLAADPLDMIQGFLGALAAGVMVAPLDPGATESELVAQVDRMGLQALVTDGDLSSEGGVTDPSGKGVGGDGSGVGGDGEAPRGAALLLASSGTTGAPKLIPLSAGQLLATAKSVAGSHRLGADDTGYSPLPLFHINGLVVGVLCTLVTGGRLVVDRRFSASRFWPTVADQGVTWLNLVPAIISILARLDPPPPEVASHVAFARSASAPLPAPVRARFEATSGVGVLETYGMTEAASQIAANPREAEHRRPGSVGRAVSIDVRVVDRHHRPVPTGGAGEVQIRGPRVVTSYWCPRPAAGDGPQTADARVEGGWLPTGDLGSLDADGFLYLAGRVDDVINRGGEKIHPREVEEVLLSDQGVAAAAVVGRPHPVVGSEPVAFVLLAPGADRCGLVARLAARCDQHLTRYKRPAEIVIAESLPAGPTGKVRHADLRRALAAGGPPGATAARTSTATPDGSQR